MRFAARSLVVMTVILTIFAGRTSHAAAHVLRGSDTPVCACPHTTETELKACCCHHGERGDQALPVDAGGSAHAALASQPVVTGEIPLPMLVGFAPEPEVTPLHGQSLQLRLDRPPQASLSL